MNKPLADRLRPNSIDDIIGQRHLLSEGKPLRRIIESGEIPNLIFYGPSGVGKTTLATYIANKTNKTLKKLNGTTASTSDIKAIVSQLDTFEGLNGILLYLDEIQYFNKKQQQTLLEYIRVHRERQHNPNSLNHREPVFLRVQRDFEPLYRVRVQVGRARRSRKSA